METPFQQVYSGTPNHKVNSSLVNPAEKYFNQLIQNWVAELSPVAEMMNSFYSVN